mmetsp:Transcript_24248/g.43139  ORF Transcript_24248/g.43139 Transcript_24248/m.43139 type:complete len:97 (-) Transcript_24248:74-364(-)
MTEKLAIVFSDKENPLSNLAPNPINPKSNLHKSHPSNSSENARAKEAMAVKTTPKIKAFTLPILCRFLAMKGEDTSVPRGIAARMMPISAGPSPLS